MITLALLIWTLPLLAFVAIVFLTRASKDLSSWLAIGAMGISTALAYVVLGQALGGARDAAELSWLTLFPAGSAAPSGQQSVLTLGIRVDPLAALMLVVVSTVSFLVHLYSRGYMVEHGHKDPGYSRFFAYLALFTFSMLGLVLADNLLLLFISWELVGLSSYLLIGFWYHKPEAWVAAKKAFITTRVGDVGFLIGILILWGAGGTLRFEELFAQAASASGPLFQAGWLGQPLLFWACLGLFCGAVGKSGQFPLHVWLPDAMEGPTPVSALIHAATMVAAGVYLVARTFPLFEAVPNALLIVAFIGGFTAIFAASMGLVNNDIKRVLAFSTVSQLGYMMFALGSGFWVAAIFHLFTHAFFKALLFLGAGSAIHATETNDIREMGGLRRVMPVTTWTTVLGGLSLAGFPLTSGFWSKDEILSEASHNAGLIPNVLLALALATVFLTAFYTFRMLFMTFFGPARGHYQHAHESPFVMTLPLVALAIPAVVVGFWGTPYLNYGLQRFLEGAEFQAPAPNVSMMLLSSALGIAGIALAAVMYLSRAFEPARVTARFGGLYTLLLNRYYVDEFYMWLIDRVAIGVGAALSVFDREGLDRLEGGAAGLTRVVGLGLRTIQTGRVQNYGLVLFAGVVAIALALLASRWLA